MMRIVLFITILVSALTGPLVFAICLGVLYAFLYTAYELLILAMIVDVYYFQGEIPYHLLGTILYLFVLEWLKPRLLFKSS